MKSKNLILAAIAILCSVAVYFFLPTIPEAGRRVIAVFVLAIFFWAFEIVPLYATSLIVVVVLTLSLGQPTQFFFIPFSSPVIMLFLGGLALAAAAHKHEVDRYLLEKMLSHIGTRSVSILIGLLLITAFFSMWISNTASAAMMLMLAKPIFDAIDRDDPLKKGLVLAIAFGANLGGIGTPIGTPPNAIALGILRENGTDISFLSWMSMTVPLALILLGITALILWLAYRPKSRRIRYKLEGTNALSSKGKWFTGIAALVILLWLTKPLHGISEAVVALGAVAILTASRLLTKEDFRHIPWDILVLMWGGLALGESVKESGLVAQVFQLPLLPDPGIQLIVIISFLAILLTSFISNTATANLLLPFAISLTPPHSIHLSIIIALACSFSCAFPISTPPNALAYSTGIVKTKDLFKSGSIISIVALGITLLGFQYIIPWFTS